MYIFVILCILFVLKYICIIKVFFIFIKKICFKFLFWKINLIFSLCGNCFKNVVYVFIFYNEIKFFFFWFNENGCLLFCFIDVFCIIKWILFKFFEVNIYGYL